MSDVVLLPDDIFSDILCLAAGSDIPCKVAVAQVPIYWRRVAPNSPLLWTCFCLSTPWDCARLPLVLERCGPSALLDFEVSGAIYRHAARAPTELELAMYALEPYAARIRVLDTALPSESLLKVKLDFAALHTLRAHSKGFDMPPTISLQAPNLRVLDLNSVGPVHLRRLISERIEELHIRWCRGVSHGYLLTILARCVRVLRLTFWSEEQDVRPEYLRDLHWSRPPLRHLRTLNLRLPILLTLKVLDYVMHKDNIISSVELCFPVYIITADLVLLWPALPLPTGHITGLEMESGDGVTLFDDRGRVFSIHTAFHDRPACAQIWPCISAAYRAHETIRDITIPLYLWSDMAEHFAAHPPSALRRLRLLILDRFSPIRSVHLPSLRRVEFGDMIGPGRIKDSLVPVAVKFLRHIVCDDGQKLEVELDAQIPGVEDMRELLMREGGGRYQLMNGV